MTGRAERLAALEAAASFLRCPVCAQELVVEGPSLRCGRGHTFDIARQGHVNLRPGSSKATGDDAAMVDDRDRFLRAGHYEPLRAALGAEAARVDAAGCVADVGAGTGWYLAGVLDACQGRVGIALDASSAALRRAAGAHPRAAAVGADVWSGLPLRDRAAALALVVFAPRNPGELARVVAPAGRLLVVTPTSTHLAPARQALGLLEVEAGKEARLEEGLAPHFRRERVQVVEFGIAVTHQDVLALVGMGPSARHLTAGDVRGRLDGLPEPWSLPVSVRLAVYQPR